MCSLSGSHANRTAQVQATGKQAPSWSSSTVSNGPSVGMLQHDVLTIVAVTTMLLVTGSGRVRDCSAAPAGSWHRPKHGRLAGDKQAGHGVHDVLP